MRAEPPHNSTRIPLQSFSPIGNVPELPEDSNTGAGAGGSAAILN
jgi:hypothetical protein